MSDETKNTKETEETPDQELARLRKANEEQAKVIAEQMEKLENAEASASQGKKVITINKKKYQVNSPKFTLPGIAGGRVARLVTVDDLVKDRALQKELIEMGSGVLTEVKKPVKKSDK